LSLKVVLDAAEDGLRTQEASPEFIYDSVQGEKTGWREGWSSRRYDSDRRIIKMTS